MARQPGGRHPAGSLTKEFPLDSVDSTFRAISPGMAYGDLRQWAATNTNDAIPAILRNRFLLVRNDQIVYDEFLSLAAAEGLAAARTRKVMYFVWAYRDERIRRFVCERLANSHGLWRPTEVVRKGNAAFFEEFVSADTAPKARSNYERFLVEAGIFNETTRTVMLDLNDGWLTDAARVAAQHEPNALRRRALLNNPAEFLIANDWLGLANATAETLRGLPPVASPSPDPFEDLQLEIPTMQPSAGRPWNRPPPTPATRRAATITNDPVDLDRANQAHYRLEQIMAAAVRALGREPMSNEHVDLYVLTIDDVVLAEMKSCQQNNLHAQVRRGISQLLEYRYIYQGLFGARRVTMVLVLETRPSAAQAWLIEYAATLDILVVWKEAASDRLVSGAVIPPALDGLVHAVP